MAKKKNKIGTYLLGFGLAFLLVGVASKVDMGGDFVRRDAISSDSEFLNQTLRHWLAGKTMEERNAFVDAVFGLLGTGDVDDAREIILPWNILNYVRTLNEDEQMRKTISHAFADLIRSAIALRKSGSTKMLKS